MLKAYSIPDIEKQKASITMSIILGHPGEMSYKVIIVCISGWSRCCKVIQSRPYNSDIQGQYSQVLTNDNAFQDSICQGLYCIYQLTSHCEVSYHSTLQTVQLKDMKDATSGILTILTIVNIYTPVFPYELPVLLSMG